jgi:hypothetical protein
MRIGAGIVFFDDAKGLERCLHSIASNVDLVITIDGKFKEFDEDYDISIDGSREVVESFPNTKYYCYPNFTEIEKRNKYLEIAAKLGIDFLIVIDSDEYAVIDKDELRRNLQIIKSGKELSEACNQYIPEVYGIKMFEEHYEKQNRIIERYNERLLYKPGYLRYSSIHSNLIDINNRNRNFTTSKYTGEIHGITLYNDDRLRSSSYISKILKYQTYLFNSEKLERKRIVGYETLRYK